MKQSRAMSLVEAGADVVVGSLLAISTQLVCTNGSGTGLRMARREVFTW